MTVELIVPEVGESITEVQVGTWLKAVGDSAEPDEGLVDPELPVDLVVGSARRIPEAKVALSTNLAFGGANSCILMVAAEVSS